jgi:hypothetical protein
VERRRVTIAVALVLAALLAAGAAAYFLTLRTAAPPPSRHRALAARSVEPGEPAVSGTLVVWSDRRRGDARSNVYVYDERRGTVRRLTADVADAIQPAVHGSTIVYAQRGETGSRIVRYDVPTAAFSVVAEAPGRRLAPATDGTWVVWEDYRSGFAPAVYARRLSGGPELRVPAGRRGGQTRPRVAEGFVVWEEAPSSFDQSSAPAVFGYDLDKGGKAVPVSATREAAILPDTDGRTVVWAQSKGRDLDVVAWNRAMDLRRPVASGPREQTLPRVSGERVYWVENTSGRTLVRFATLADRTARPLTTVAGGDQTGVAAEGTSVAWLERTRRGWVVRSLQMTAPGRSRRRTSPSMQAALPGASVVAPALARLPIPRPLVFGVPAVVQAQAQSPARPTEPRARVDGTSAVSVSWESVQGADAYEVFRSPVPMTSAAAGTPVATTTATAVRIDAAPGEAAAAFTWYYAVRAVNAAGLPSALSENVAPDPHGAFGSPGVPTASCRVCHFGRGPGLVPGARAQCYGCHGGTAGTSDYGAGSTLDVQASFRDDTATPPPASQHRNRTMSDTDQECDACHTPHRRPFDPDPAASFTMLLRTRLASAEGGAFRYDTSATPVGDQFCFDCHGPDVTPISIVGGPTAYADAGGDLSAGWAGTAHGRMTAPDRDPGIRCLACHDPHASTVPLLLGRLDPRSGVAYVGASAVTGNDRSVCYGCHSGPSAGYPTPSYDASGFPVSGTWPGRTTYEATRDAGTHEGGIHNGAGVVWPGTSYDPGACQNCHAVHGPSNRYDILRDTDSAGTPGRAGFAADSFGFCFTCHGSRGPAADVATFYPTTAEGSATTLPRAGHATVTSGTLTAGSALPCYDCHDPHGSASAYGLRVVTQRDAVTTVVVGDETGEVTMTPSRSAGDVRNFCLTCHTTNDAPDGLPLGWDGAALSTVAPGAAVEGIDRTAGRLRLPTLPGHISTAVASCYDCHGDDYAGTAGNVHAPGSPQQSSATSLPPPPPVESTTTSSEPTSLGP